jgi:predicted membrane-bound spermidine synthase
LGRRTRCPRSQCAGYAFPSGLSNVQSMPSRLSLYLTLFCLGVLAQVAQALLVRELLVVFYGNEVSLGAFFASWLFWVGVGSLAVIPTGVFRHTEVARRPRRGGAVGQGSLLVAILGALPWLLGLQILAARLSRGFMETSSVELLGLGELLLATFVITLPTGLALGAAFPLACRLLAQLRPSQPVGAVSRLYIFDAMGAFAGGLLFTFVLVERLDVWSSLGVSALLLSVAAWALGPRSAGLKGVLVATGLVGGLLLVPPLEEPISRAAEQLRFSSIHPGLELLETTETRYGHVAVARVGEQYSVVRDGRVAESFPDPKPVAQAGAFFQAEASGPRRILMLGAPSLELAADLLRYPLERLDLVLDDRRAFEQIRPYLGADTQRALGDARLSLHFQDGRRFVNELGAATYDLVLVLGVDPSSAHQNRYFTRELYRQVLGAMSLNGVLCTSVDSASNYLGREVQGYGSAVLHTLESVFDEVIVVPGDQQLMCGSQAKGQVSTDPEQLAERYLAIPLAERRFPAEGFSLMLEPERVGFVRKRLEQGKTVLNTDLRPVTYYLNMILWGKFTASAFVTFLQALGRLGIWPYIVPLGLFVGLMLLRQALEDSDGDIRRRQAGTLALAVLGLIAMAVQLELIFSYQAHVGFAFGRIALLNGLFMTGLALGAGLIGQRLAGSARAGLAFAGVLAIVALGCAALPGMLGRLGAAPGVYQEGGYLLFVFLAGLLTGMGFPLGVRQAHLVHGEVGRSSGVAAAADNLGGAVGGLLTGGFLVPILGVTGTSRVLTVAALLALTPLLLAELRRFSTPGLRARGFRSFPAPGLSWALVFIALALFLLSLIVRQAVEGPQVDFDPETLAAVSGSPEQQRRAHPFVHYLGQGGDREATVSLSSMEVAADVRGYAGPLNLLVSVDQRGQLRGARYIASDETPAYIHGIDDWLAGLAGEDLSLAPLDLKRVDALSGATVSSEAALAAINRAAVAGAREAFGLELAGARADQASWWRELVTPRFLGVLTLLVLFFPVYLTGRDRARLIYQLAVLIVLGFSFNSLVTEVDLVNLGQGRIPAFTSNPTWYLLVGFVGVTGLLFGQAYCGYVCPFGALQEVLSRVGRRLGLRRYVDARLDRAARYLKFLLLVGALGLVWVTGEVVWIGFNPMQHLFRGQLAGWMGAIAALSLLGALFYFRFWCRYLCPMGAFLALSNKLALLKGRAPQRVIRRCDLGVRDEYDVDCIHCNRCIDRVDLGVLPVGGRKDRDPRGRAEAHRKATNVSVSNGD